MGLAPGFSKKDIRSFINKKLADHKKAMESRLIRAGEEFVSKARQNGEYLDQTGNLRSSIGYIVLYNRNSISENFESTGGEKGIKEAKSLISKLSSEYSTGYVLICVAGMDYAAAVESRGRDVITGTSQIVEVTLKQALKRIQDR